MESLFPNWLHLFRYNLARFPGKTMLDLNVIELDGALRWFPLHNPAAADDQGGQVETQVLAAEDSHLLYKGEYHSENLSILGGGGGFKTSSPHFWCISQAPNKFFGTFNSWFNFDIYSQIACFISLHKAWWNRQRLYHCIADLLFKWQPWIQQFCFFEIINIFVCLIGSKPSTLLLLPLRMSV